MTSLTANVDELRRFCEQECLPIPRIIGVRVLSGDLCRDVEVFGYNSVTCPVTDGDQVIVTKLVNQKFCRGSEIWINYLRKKK